jgi:hypothetical protein
MESPTLYKGRVICAVWHAAKLLGNGNLQVMTKLPFWLFDEKTSHFIKIGELRIAKQTSPWIGKFFPLRVLLLDSVAALFALRYYSENEFSWSQTPLAR